MAQARSTKRRRTGVRIKTPHFLYENPAPAPANEDARPGQPSFGHSKAS